MLKFYLLTLLALIQLTYQQDDGLNTEMLTCINKYRLSHQVSELKLNEELVALAQKEAQRLAKLGQFLTDAVYYSGKVLGKNMFTKSLATGNLGKEACETWYSNRKLHDYDTNFSQQTGTFTQMIWKGSKEIGTGKAIASNGMVFVVSLFYPAGNVALQFKSNVFPTYNKR